MPQTEQFLNDMAGENRQAALLVVQVGAAPTELQIVTQVAEFDEKVEGLRPIRSYIIRALGVLEHQVVNFGMTVDKVEILTQHPLLDEYTTAPTAVFFRGKPENVDALVLDIAQAHAQTFFPWRHFPTYLNNEQALSTLMASGGGLLGQMPATLAQRAVKVLEHHKLETKTAEGTAYIKAHDNPGLLQSTLKVMLFGQSYFIAYGFSIDEMKGRS